MPMHDVGTPEVQSPLISYPVLDGQTLIGGGMVALNVAGLAVGDPLDQTMRIVGRCEARVVGVGGNVTPVRVRAGSFRLDMGTGADVLTAADIQGAVYAINSYTVGKTDGGGTRPRAGILLAMDFDLPIVMLGVLPSVAAAESSGIDARQHATLRQLVHLADGAGGPWEEWTSGSFRETLPVADPFPTSVTWYADATKAVKIVSKAIVFGARKLPLAISWTAYAADGATALVTVTDTITYSGVFETSRTRTVTP